MSFRLNQKVEVLNKNCFGVIKYVGLTSFQPGSWVGVVLDEPLGKNNGTVQGRTYFKCRENHGIFVRPDQVVLVSGNNSRASSRRSSISIDEDSDITNNKRRSLVGEKELKSKPTSLPRSRVSRNSSKLSLSNSRHSLNESGAAANLNSSLNQNDLDNSLTKCESFIETDFVENLTPEFKQPLSRSYLQQSIDEKYYLELQETNVKLVGESENLRKQIQEMSEKYEKLQKMLSHDKEKTKDFDVLQLQNEKLNEFKTKIMENHQILQRELQKTKNELEDMQNLRDNHSKEMNELMNLLEMATLDKEMAEERVELIQADLESCHEKIAELELNLKVLKEEFENRQTEQCENSDDATKYSYQVKQVEQQNERLREVLIKMRDIAATEKNDHQKLVKEFETKKSEINELSKIKEKLSSRVEEQENKILELQAQIDATLGSEEMIVLLTDQNLNFRDKIENLENNLTDSQNLIEVLEQINEANQDINLQLREEIDLSKNSVAKLTAKNESLMEIISDRELTIGKFRDLVQQLHKQLSKMKEALSHQQQESYSSMPSVTFVDNIDFNKIFSETKAYLQNVDIDLRKIEVQELLQHVKYLMSFMPNSFDSAGGDYYSVLTLLLISRLNLKTDVLLNHVRDRFTNIEELNKKSILKDHFLKQFMFRHRLSTLIGILQCLLHQYLYALNMCSVKTLNNATEYYNEMMSQEKVVNQFLDLLKKNQLDENQNLEPLERSIIYFYTMLPLLMNEELPLYHQIDLLNDFINLLGSSFEELQNYISVLKQLALTNAVGSHEFEQLVEYCLSCLNKWNQMKKVLKRKLNSNSNGSSDNSLGLEKDFFENVFLSYFQSLKVSKCLMKTVEEAIVCIQSNNIEKQTILMGAETEATEIAVEIDCDQLMRLAAKSSAAIYEQDDLGPFVSIKESLDFVLKNVEFLVDHFEKNDSSIQKSIQLKCKPPIVVKAELFKQELSDVKALRKEIERKDLDFQSLKQKMFGMQESVSEMKLRKEIAEKKLDNMQNYKVTIEELTQERDQLKLELSLRSKEHENVCNILQEDIDALEKERNHLKDKLKYSAGRKTLGSNLLNDNFGGLNEVLVDDVKRLKRALKVVNSEKTHLVFQNLIDTVSRWKPIKCFTVKDIREDKLMTLKRELNEIYDSMLSVHLEYKLIDWSDRSEAFKTLRDRLTQKCKLKQLNSRFSQVRQKIHDELMSRQIGAKVFGDFKDFPTIGLVEALKENEPLLFGTIRIPNLSKTKQNHISVLIDNNYELKNIVNCLNI